MKNILAPVILVVAVLGGCGGGGDDPAPVAAAAPVAPVAPPAAVATYNVGGQLTGLGAGKMLVVGDAAGATATLSADGAYAVRLPKGARYDLSVVSQPADRSCTVANGTGTVRGDVIDIAVSCVDDVAVAIPAIPGGLAVTSGTKRLDFTWSTVADATTYRLLEDLDGAGPGAAVQVGAAVATNARSYVPQALLHTRLNAQYRVQACNAAGCSPASLPVTPGLNAAIGYFKASNTEALDNFGSSVALSADGSTLAVGAADEDSNATGVNGNQSNNGGDSVGAVYVFVRGAGGAWTQQAYLKTSRAADGGQFGQALALSSSGAVLAASATGEDSFAGAAYVFSRNASGAWGQQARVVASHREANDIFGEALSLSGDGTVLAVGAVSEDSGATGVGGNGADNSVPSAGAVYVFRHAGGTWTQEAYLKASNTIIGGNFGSAVALSDDGTTLGVGESSGNGRAGAAYVFTRAGGPWAEQAFLTAFNGVGRDLFGYALGLSGDGSTLAVGAPFGGGGGTGAAYVFTRTGTAWSQQAYLTATNAENDDWFGFGLALSADGNTLAVGAPREDSAGAGLDGDPASNGRTFSGAAYVFSRAGSLWSHAAYLKPPNPSANGFFGDRAALALSADGTSLVVGGGDSSSARGVQGNQADTSMPSAGAVYLY